MCVQERFASLGADERSDLGMATVVDAMSPDSDADLVGLVVVGEVYRQLNLSFESVVEEGGCRWTLEEWLPALARV